MDDCKPQMFSSRMCEHGTKGCNVNHGKSEQIGPMRTQAQSEPSTQTAVTPSPHPARWVVELNCDCPNCGKWVKLLDHPDFWDGRTLDIPENGTAQSNNLEVVCPECDHEFNVCCEW